MQPHIDEIKVITIKGQDQIWKMNPRVHNGSGNGMATGATFFSGELGFSGQNCRDPKGNQNARSIHLWKAGMMYIIPVPLNSTLDLYIERNQRWKFGGVHHELNGFQKLNA